MPRRRLSLVVTAGVLAVLALTGCRVEPGNAAFVGNTSYSKAELDTMVAAFKADGGNLQASAEGDLRAELARDEVFVAVAKRYTEEQGFGAPKVDAAALAQRFSLPEHDQVVDLVARTIGYRDLLFSHIKAVTPTDAEMRASYERVANYGTYDEVARQLRAVPGFGQAIAVRRVLVDAVKRYNVALNPLYDGDFILLEVPTASGQNLPIVVLPLSGDGPRSAVRDLPTQ